MPEIDCAMDLFINPSVNNKTLEQLLSNNAKTQSEQIDTFEKVFDDINELFEQNINNMTKPLTKSEKSEEKDNTICENLLTLLGNNFGPPIGVEIEGFDYSLIQ